MHLSRLLIIDAIALIIYLVAANPLITGLAVHEWASIGILVFAVVHGIQHYDWFVETFKSLRSRLPFVQAARLVLDLLIIVVFMLATVSGILVSRYILPMMGLVAPGYFFWNPLHSFSAKLLLALLVVHVAINAGRIWAFLKSRVKKKHDEGSKQD